MWSSRKIADEFQWYLGGGGDNGYKNNRLNSWNLNFEFICTVAIPLILFFSNKNWIFLCTFWGNYFQVKQIFEKLKENFSRKPVSNHKIKVYFFSHFSLFQALFKSQISNRIFGSRLESPQGYLNNSTPASFMINWNDFLFFSCKKEGSESDFN